ncbi:MAG: hypothetical protein IPM82_14795 [Saprospiraceae bacterium]|nr:hypothetical protein [Saprospiraceae bacterium]
MKDGNKNKHLGRTMEHRQAMFENMSNSLIEHKRIKKLPSKAKALRKYFEPLVTRARENTTLSVGLCLATCRARKPSRTFWPNRAKPLATAQVAMCASSAPATVMATLPTWR